VKQRPSLTDACCER